VNALQKKIFSYYEKEGRDLPWRHTTNRYYILVSELMLQQTQVSRVIEKYVAWIERFPTVQSLAKAPLKEVLALWSGLGYNSRAKRLQDTAKILMEKYNGKVPSTAEELITLPGIGPYTSRSVLIFADNQDLATVDTNIRRILIHELQLPETISDKELFAHAQKLLPKGRSRDWHNALMDYGATHLSARKTGIQAKTKQSTFKNSRRYYRGQILKILTQKENITLKRLQELYTDCPHDFDTILAEMLAEGLLKKKRAHYSIA
jgi:A/G-specific adenine glycosylase